MYMHLCTCSRDSHITEKCVALILAVVERMMNVTRTKIQHAYAMESRMCVRARVCVGGGGYAELTEKNI